MVHVCQMVEGWFVVLGFGLSCQGAAATADGSAPHAGPAAWDRPAADQERGEG